ncbi:MAG: hypothetical protein FH756_01475 [Firmicutes bacterium]|nr:hypothetical protein [Bacillota bacterium]
MGRDIMLICIDPGHGGRDPGAVSKCGKYQENNNVLAIAKEIHVRKDDLPAVDFIFTRLVDGYFSANELADLQARCDIANSAGADLFVSIHQNGDINYQGRGIETFSMAETGEGRKLAKAIQDQLVKQTGLINRGLKTANWYVLRNTKMPAVLVECGFVGGDPEEAEYVSRPETLKLFADCILRGIADYLNIKLEDGKLSKFKDLDKCMYPELALEAIKEGLVGGFPDGTLRPDASLTREQGWLIDLRQQRVFGQAHNIPKMVDQFMPSIVRIWSNGTVGSGSFIAPNYILTNSHVANGQKEVTIDTDTRDQVKGKVVKDAGGHAGDGLDLALIETEFTGPPLALAEKIVHGEFCLALGMPAGEWQSVSAGIVTRYGGDFLQVDALVNPGNSGGAIINSAGQLIGVPTWKFVAQGFDNHNYDIVVDRVKEFIKGVV